MVLFEMLEDILETPVFLGQFEHYLKKNSTFRGVSCQIYWPFDLVRLDLQAWTVSTWVSMFTHCGTFAGVKL